MPGEVELVNLERNRMPTRLPCPALRPFVRMLWASEPAPSHGTAFVARERVLPTGLMHVAFRLSGEPFRIVGDSDDPRLLTSAFAVVGGARSGPYVREIAPRAASVGALLGPGACATLFALPAAVLAESHTPLEALWGRDAALLSERMAGETSTAARLDILEAALAARLPRAHGLHPAVAQALARLDAHSGVREAVRQSGYSHRHFNALFRHAVGLTPKRYCRVQRLRSIVARLARHSGALADIAASAGYSDQSHFNRDFRELAGMTPREFCAAAPRRPHHVPLAG